MSDAHRAQLARRRTDLARQLDTLRPHAQRAGRRLLELESSGTDPGLLAFAQEAAALLDDRCTRRPSPHHTPRA